MSRSRIAPVVVGGYAVPDPFHNADEMARFRGDDLSGMDALDLQGERICLVQALASTRYHDGHDVLIPWPNAYVTFGAWAHGRVRSIEAELYRRSGRRRP
jgi:hypothetical protein